MEITGKEVKLLRDSKSMSQQEFAHEIDFVMSTVANWESGRNIPSRKAVIRITQTFGKDCFNGQNR